MIRAVTRLGRAGSCRPDHVRGTSWRLLAGLLATTSAVAVTPAAEVERNVVYGMVSGAALLLDVYHPAPGLARRRGVLFVPGSGWYADRRYDTPALKDMASGWAPGDRLARTMVTRLTDAGFTVFVTNHRAAPAFRYPAAVDDLARAATFLRAQAERFGIDGTRLGGVGTSSGGNLVSLLASDDRLPATSRLDAVVTLGAPMDMIAMFEATDASAAAVVTWIGHGIAFLPSDHPEVETWRRAGTAGHASKNDAPHLLIHGSEDELVPLAQARAMHRRWQALGVPTGLIVIAGGGHSERLLGDGAPWLDRMTAFLGEHLAAPAHERSQPETSLSPQS